MFRKSIFLIAVLSVLTLCACSKQKTPEEYVDMFFELVTEYNKGAITSQEFIDNLHVIKGEISRIDVKTPGFEDEFNQKMSERFDNDPMFQGMMNFGDSGEYMNLSLMQ